MTTKQYHHTEIASPVRLVYMQIDRKGGYAKAGRVVSGLLKAAVKSRAAKKTERHGRVTGSSVCYHLTDEQLTAIRAEAIRRVKLTNVAVEEDVRLLASVS